MELQLQSGSTAITVADATFAAPFNEDLIHQIVTAYQAAGRAGTRAQKTRAEVRGGGRKPWRQKGTGRARAGTIRSPLWRGGGITFAAVPADHAPKVNKKMYRGALRAIVSELVRQQRLVVVDEFMLAVAKTKELKAKLLAMELSDVLIVTKDADAILSLAARNLYHVGACAVTELNPVILLGFNRVLMTVPALRALEERLA